MPTPVGSGLFSQFGIATETTVNTAVAVTRFIEFNSETLARKRDIAQGVGLRAGGLYPRGARRILVSHKATGDVTFDVPTNGLGLVLQHMLGSFATTATQIGTTGAWQQIHNTGPLQGKTFTAQKAAPSLVPTVEPFTYPGCKISDWELTCQQKQIATLKLTIDAQQENTSADGGVNALQTASYGASTGLFAFHQGAVTTNTGTTVTGGIWTGTTPTTLATVTKIDLKGSNPLHTDRFFAGSQVQQEAIDNNFRAYTGSVDLEFANRTLYDQYRADGNTALQVSFTGAVIAGTNKFTLSFYMPWVNFEDSATPLVAGPDVITVTVPFTVLDDGVNGAVQALYISTDTTV